jgi:hypothetical protein
MEPEVSFIYLDGWAKLKQQKQRRDNCVLTSFMDNLPVLKLSNSDTVHRLAVLKNFF